MDQHTERQREAQLSTLYIFHLVSDQPYQIMMASNGQKDSLSNVESTGEMVFNGVSHQHLTP